MLIKWAARVDPMLLRRLYQSDAKNIRDNSLADEVGYGLYARSVSLIKVNRAHHEFIIDCPLCDSELQCKSSSYLCACGWCITKKEHHLTYKHKQLVAISIVPFAKKFISDWERAKDDYTAKMKAIDYLIHCFHYELEENRNSARPAIINFIDCKMNLAVELIFELAYGHGSKGYNEEMQRWLNNAKTSHLFELIRSKEKIKR